MTTKTYQYLYLFDAREMVQIMSDKQPSEEEARAQLYKQLAARGNAQPPWHLTDVIEMDEDGETMYYVYDGSRWVRREELECNG